MKYKVDLESHLTAALQRKVPGPLSQVLISADGELAVFYMGDKHTTRKLSRYGKEFLCTGDVVLGSGESFLEPE
jgi:hypothetical protein